MLSELYLKMDYVHNSVEAALNESQTKWEEKHASRKSRQCT